MRGLQHDLGLVGRPGTHSFVATRSAGYRSSTWPGKTSRIFLKGNGYLFQARFSPEEKWVVFQGSGLWIAPIRSGLAAGEDEWIAITEITERGDKPRWS